MQACFFLIKKLLLLETSRNVGFGRLTVRQRRFDVGFDRVVGRFDVGFRRQNKVSHTTIKRWSTDVEPTLVCLYWVYINLLLLCRVASHVIKPKRGESETSKSSYRLPAVLLQTCVAFGVSFVSGRNVNWRGCYPPYGHSFSVSNYRSLWRKSFA